MFALWFVLLPSIAFASSLHVAGALTEDFYLHLQERYSLEGPLDFCRDLPAEEPLCKVFKKKYRLKVLEATVDSFPASSWRDGRRFCLHVPPGRHEIVLEYSRKAYLQERQGVFLSLSFPKVDSLSGSLDVPETLWKSAI